MKILAFDATAAIGAVALTDDQTVLATRHTEGARTHSETLLPIALDVLSGAGLTLDDVDLFACSVGPGSFTGVRIAASLVKGLALPHGKPCVGVSSLKALAYPLRETDGIICPVIDARRGNVYNALFEHGKRLCADRLIGLDALCAELASCGKPVYFCGDAYALAKELLPTAADTPEQYRIINGAAVAQAALARYSAGGDFDPDALRPEYLRPTQAQREREERTHE